MDYTLVRQSLILCPQFQALDETARAFLFWRGEVKTMPICTDIYVEGKPCNDTFGFVLEGELAVLQSEKVVAKIPKGSVFGEVAFFTQQKKRTSTVRVASEQATCFMIRMDERELQSEIFAKLRKQLSGQAWATMVDGTREK